MEKELIELTDELAEQIEKLSEAIDILDKSRLNRRAILLLLRDHTGTGLKEIELVLTAVKELPKNYLNEKRK